MAQRIPNSILTENEFADLIADELANYVDSHINNYLNFTGSDKQFIKTKEKKWPPFKLKCPAATSLGLLPPTTALRGRQHLPTLQQLSQRFWVPKGANLLMIKNKELKKIY